MKTKVTVGRLGHNDTGDIEDYEEREFDTSSLRGAIAKAITLARAKFTTDIYAITITVEKL